ncbi:hypothetical protein QA641_40335 [Bradyrhizobium sp. CB1650]|uniref:hypothetical protein n=1 Tax=Bradyrhizobium sp. CB1650 TaxID=3039153 RepID=UPI00243502FC|nr:hypothetical protein [Bradyrhizobium sp. CB1650]WGD51609.1 hypothetical protein QA641_40335 [Bradyrhizobium sp. CB1650]
MRRFAFVSLCSVAVLLSGCITTAMQGYADRDLPPRPIQRIATYVVAPTALASSFQSSIAEEATKRGIAAEDAYALLPPTRTYNDAEIRKILAESAIDAVLIINVGDTGVVKEYAGTFFQGQYSSSTDVGGTVTRNGNFSNVSLAATTSGTMTGTATPMHRYSRQTVFKARLVDPATTRNFWVGSGEVSAGGRLFVGNGSSASSSVSAIFDDLRSKKIIGGTS